MAVHLKKRAYEEFNHVIQEAPKPQLKKLRLTKLPVTSSQTKFEDFQLELSGKSSQDVLQILMDFSKSLPVPAEYVQQCVDALKVHFLKENDSTVRMKIAWLLGQLCNTSDFYPVHAIEEVVFLLDAEVSGKVLSQLWSSILVIAMRLPSELPVQQQILDIAYSSLNNHHQEVRCQCLKVIGNLATSRSTVKGTAGNHRSSANIHKLVADYFDDPEPRVRSTSLQAMILMHQRGQQLELSVYEQACCLLDDDYEQVRFTAAQLVWILSHIYPESPVKSAYVDETLRLVDDAFAKICDLFNDSAYKVRAEAARLLGSMHLVSDSFLFQTLDKKLMSDLRRKKSLNEQAKEGFVEEFATGARWGEDAPRDLNPDATNLMHSGACGAFVHGLEDEMMEVRSAAVDSLTELASQRSNPSFAQAALDFLVDCLNDEIEAVRLNAVNSLHKIVEHVTLYEDQLDNVHSAMEDACKEIREGIHNLLSNCSLMSKACLFDTVLMLLKNLNKYPQDRRSVWRTHQKLGQHHSELVYLLVPQLLSCHPYFDTAEPQMDDPSYIAILILVFNAAESCSAMAQLFPEHVIRHYQYLKDSIPELVPQVLKLTSFTAGVDLCLRSPPRKSNVDSDPSAFLDRAISRVKNLQTCDPTTQKSLLEWTIRDLRHAAEVAPALSSTAQHSADFLEAQLLLVKPRVKTLIETNVKKSDCNLMLGLNQKNMKVLVCEVNEIFEAVDRKVWSGSTHICAQHMAFAKPAAERIIQLTQELEHLYLGQSTEKIAVIRQLRLKAQSLMFVLEMQEVTQSKTRNSSADKPPNPSRLRDEFLTVLQNLKAFLAERNVTPDSFSRTLFSEALKVPTSKKTSLVVKLIQQLLSHYSISISDLNNKVQRSRVIVHEPQPRLDSPVILSAGLSAALHVDFTAENIVNPLTDVQIKVTYPDATEQKFQLRPPDIKQLSEFKHHITTKVFLSHTQWTDSSTIKLSFLKVAQGASKARSGDDRHILLCNPVQVSMHPKPPARS